MFSTVLILSLLYWVAAPRPPMETRPRLDDLAFMSGCWEGKFQARDGTGTIEEFYTTPSANVMLGTTRYISHGKTVSFEFSLLLEDSVGVILRPYPNGKPSSDDFRLTQVGEARVTFESPAHDYPKRIHYWTEEDGTRVARIDGGADDPEGVEWRLRHTHCP